MEVRSVDADSSGYAEATWLECEQIRWTRCRNYVLAPLPSLRLHSVALTSAAAHTPSIRGPNADAWTWQGWKREGGRRGEAREGAEWRAGVGKRGGWNGEVGEGLKMSGSCDVACYQHKIELVIYRHPRS